MKKTKYYLLVIVLIFVTCGKNNINKAKELIEIGDYTQAVSNLNIEIEKNPKNIDARELLVKCYDYKKEWNKAIEQLKILNKLVPSNNYDTKLLKFYVLDEQFIEYEELLDLYKDTKYINYFEILDSIHTKYNNEYYEILKKNLLPYADSIKLNPDSILVKYENWPDDMLFINHKLKKYVYGIDKRIDKILQVETNQKKIHVLDSLNLKDFFLAFYLAELYDNEYDYYWAFYEECAKWSYIKDLEFFESDSSSIKYIKYIEQKF